MAIARRAEGRPALCEPGAAANLAGTLLGGTRRLTRDGAPVNHHLGCSIFADYAVVSRRSVVRIDPDVPLVHAALFGCAVLTGVGAVVNTAAVRAGASVAVVGLGGVGLAAVLGAVAAGARQIVAVDLADDKLALARTLGATDTVNAGAADAADAVRALTGGGAEFVFEFAGSVRALEFAYRVTRRGGMTVTAGLPPAAATFAVPAVNLVAEERTIKGSYVGTCVPSRDIPHFIALYRQDGCPYSACCRARSRSTTSTRASTGCRTAAPCARSSCSTARARAACRGRATARRRARRAARIPLRQPARTSRDPAVASRRRAARDRRRSAGGARTRHTPAGRVPASASA